jgi:hypothetical protein
MLKRIGYAGSGLLNAGVGVTALQLAFGERQQAGGSQTFVAKLMAQPFGQVLVAAIGLFVIVAGIYQIKKAIKREYERDLRMDLMSAMERKWVPRLARLGLAARGVVFPIIGMGLVQAAITAQPGQTKDLGDALYQIGASPFGQVLLVVVALGLAAYGLYMIVSARYHVLVRR